MHTDDTNGEYTSHFETLMKTTNPIPEFVNEL